MAVPLAERLRSVAERVRGAEAVFLFTDFDGTLVPIVDDPMTCRLDADLLSILGSIGARPATGVGVVSGRDLSDLRPRVNVEGIAYAGNHGLEIEAPGYRHVDPVAAAARPLMDRLAAELVEAFADTSGVWVQHKGLTLSVHHRRINPALVPHVLETVDRITRPDREAGGIRLTTGKSVVEVRPASEWHKGHAVRWLMSRSSSANPLAIYLGDDETDEDGFAALPGHITIHVGRNTATRAEYLVSDPASVAEFLRFLAELP